MPPTSFPILFYNLGGEMLYVLNQRLQAQNIAKEKSDKVLSDIIGTMFKSHFLKQMFESSTIYSKSSLRNIFKKLIHASVMRVSKDSMDKLFDLMLMAVKYQTISCGNPLILLDVCLNHLDTVMKFVTNDAAVKPLVVNAFNKVVKTYGCCKEGEMSIIRQRILCFLQEANVKITMYLAENIQNDFGKFVIPNCGPVPTGFQVPGTITLMDGGRTSTQMFESGGLFTPAAAVHKASHELGGARATSLGTNVYSKLTDAGSLNAGSRQWDEAREKENSKMAAAELDLLSQMLGPNSNVDRKYEFKFDLISSEQPDAFRTESSSESAADTASTSHSSGDVVNIVAANCSKEHLSKILQGLHTERKEEKDDAGGDDLLSLMDSL